MCLASPHEDAAHAAVVRFVVVRAVVGDIGAATLRMLVAAARCQNCPRRPLMCTIV